MSTIRIIAKRTLLLSASGATAVAMILTGGTVHALATTSPAQSATDQQHLQNIITKGNQEISRRLTSLNALNSRINAAMKLTASDKSYLTTEVNTEIGGLSALKAKLDAETTVAGARADEQSIFSEYRVYALVLPKVWLVKTADTQRVAEAKLSALIQKFQTRINAAKSKGKEVTAIQDVLNDMTTHVNNAQAISSSIEANVLTLQPSDYNSDHAILSGDVTQLKTAHVDNEAAYADAKNIVSSLKSL